MLTPRDNTFNRVIHKSHRPEISDFIRVFNYYNEPIPEQMDYVEARLKAGDLLTKHGFNGAMTKESINYFLDNRNPMDIYKDKILTTLEHGEDFEEEEVDDDKLVALMDAITEIRYFTRRGKMLVISIKSDEDHEIIRTVNQQNILGIQQTLLHMMNRVENVSPYTESDEDLFITLLKIQSFKLFWIPYHGGGFFPYTNSSFVDLSDYGIFDKVDEQNYVDNCFVYACIKSAIFTESEIESIRFMTRTQYILPNDLNVIAEKFHVFITVSPWNPNKGNKGGRLDDMKKYGDENANRKLSLLLRENHYMINKPVHVSSYALTHYQEIESNEAIPFERKQHVSKKDGSIDRSKTLTLNVLLGKLFEMKKFVEIEDTSKCQIFKPYEFNNTNDLDYDDSEIKPITPIATKNPIEFLFVTSKGFIDEKLNLVKFEALPKGLYFVNDFEILLKKFDKAHCGLNNNRMASFSHGGSRFMHIQEIYAEPDELKNLKPNEYFKRVREYVDALHEITNEQFTEQNTTLAQFAWNAFINNGCVDNMYKLSGKPKWFISKCVRGGMIWACQEQTINDEFVDVDLNSSYASALDSLEWMPCGKPIPFYKTLPDSCYFVKIDILDYSPKTNLVYQPITHPGIHYVDWITLKQWNVLYDLHYDVLCGYKFEPQKNVHVQEFIEKLYNAKQSSSTAHAVKTAIKHIFCRIYGKCKPRPKYSKTVCVNESQKSKKIIEAGPWFLGYEKRDGKYYFDIAKPFENTYCMPHIASIILSQAKNSVYELLSRINPNNVYRIYTDSIIMNKKEFECIKDVVSQKLGGWKIEFEGDELFIKNSQNFIAKQNGDVVRVRGPEMHKLVECP